MTHPQTLGGGLIGIGLDMVAVARIERALKRRPALAERLFAKEEREACLRQRDPYPSLAARFAAKEACMKALGTGLGGGVGFLDFVVSGGSGSPPALRLLGAAGERFRRMGGRRAHLSLTHDGPFAAAIVVLEGVPEPSTE